MKRVIAIVAAVCALCACLLGCGASNSFASNYVGTWSLAETSGDQALTEDQIKLLKALGSFDIVINLEEDGKAVMSTVSGQKSETTEGTWIAESATQGMITFNGVESPITLEDEKLSLSSGDATMSFKRTESQDSTPTADTDSANGDSVSAASVAAEAGVAASAGGAAASSASAANVSAGAESNSNNETSSSPEEYEASIDAVEVANDYSGNPALVVTVSWKNNSSKTRSFAAALHQKCFQNGVQLDPAFMVDGVDSNGYMSDVRPGYGTTFQMAYELQDTENPVDIEISEFISFNDTPIATKTYEF